MKEKIKKWLKPVLFTAGGALVGLAYYYFVGCPTGACPLTSKRDSTSSLAVFSLSITMRSLLGIVPKIPLYVSKFSTGLTQHVLENEIHYKQTKEKPL